MSERLAAGAGAEAGRPMWTCPSIAGAIVLRDRVRLNIALTRRLEAPWVERIESYGPRWNAHRFMARSPADVDAIAELPALVCEGYRDLGMQGSLRQARPSPMAC